MTRTFPALLGSIALCALAGTASADGMAKRGTAAADTSGQVNWSGVYFGAHGGYAWGETGGLTYPGTVPSSPSASPEPDAWLAGGHIGAQHQFGSLLAGVELSASRAFGDKASEDCSNLGFAGPTHSCFADLKSFFTVGGRLGWAVDRWLIYGTGGYARARITSGLDHVGPGAPFGHWRASEAHNGWFIGGGLEYAVTPNVILGVDYKHLDLERATHDSGCNVGGPGGPCTPFAGLHHNFDASAEVLTARLSYKFGRDTVREAVPLK